MQLNMNERASRRGFTFIELVVVISILAILAGALIPRVTERMARARDARRLSAIEQYYLDHNQYPEANSNPLYGGWDVSHDEDFIRILRDEGYLAEEARDPINDDTYHYRYYFYSRGSYGWKGESEFFVLGVRNFETADFAKHNKGFFKCSGQDWGNEFAYVTGGGAMMDL